MLSNNSILLYKFYLIVISYFLLLLKKTAGYNRLSHEFVSFSAMLY